MTPTTQAGATSAEDTVTIDHEFKSHPDVFWPAARGEKTFEFRRDDRGGYEVGQTVRLRCYDPDHGYHGNPPLDRRITNILRGGEFELPQGYCILSLAPLASQPPTWAPKSKRETLEEAFAAAACCASCATPLDCYQGKPCRLETAGALASRSPSPAVVPEVVRRLSEAAASLIADLDRSLNGVRDQRVITATNASVKRLRSLLAYGLPSGPTVVESDRDGHWTQMSPGDGFMWHPGPQSLGDTNVALDAPPSGRAAEGGEYAWDDETRIAINTDAEQRIAAIERSQPFEVSKHLSTVNAHVLGIYDQTTDRMIRTLAVALKACAVEAVEAALARSAPTPPASAGDVDELTEDELRRRAKAMVLDQGWKPGEHMSGHTVAELMVRFGLSIMRKPPEDRCAYPSCGCDHDATCGNALATAPAAPEPAAGGEDAEQRIDNLVAALASARRQMNEQAARATAAEQRVIELEQGAVHPALSIDVQQHRNQAYQTGWDDGYAEGHAKASSTPTRADAGAEGRRA